MNLSAGNNIKQAHNLTDTTLEKVIQIIKEEKVKTTDKSSAPFYLPSGLFTKNSIDGIKPESYTGLICIDIDNVPNDKLELLRRDIHSYGENYHDTTNPFKAIVKSFSNNLYILIQTSNRDHTLHKFYYDCAYNLVKDAIDTINVEHNLNLNLKLDYLPNLNRARFLSADKDIYYNRYSFYEPLPSDIAFALSRQQPQNVATKQTEQSRANSQNVDSTKQNKEYLLALASQWATHKYGEFIHDQKGNRDNWLHHYSSATNNLGVPKEESITHLISNYYTDQETGELYSTFTTNEEGVLRPIESAYKRTDQFGTYILHSDKDIKDRVQTLINKKLIYLSKNEEKNVYLLDEINLLRELKELI